jgi:EAL domain-containing protein (putative c-di-GMP-specific phosphodiesterase class I)
LKQAIAALEDWFRHFPQDPPLFLSVNVSPRQLFRADFVNEVSSLLRGRAFPPGALKLEVTETVVMRDLERSMAVLSALRKLGVGLSLDDFGTGYSSLSYLQRFPFDALKIDRSFVTSLTATQDAGVIVNSIITLAHSLNMNVVAEGVENQPEAVKLAQMGCEFAQGYLFGQAMDARGVMQMLMQRARPYPGHTPGLGPAAGGRKL